jgi:hypothetical protein
MEWRWWGAGGGGSLGPLKLCKGMTSYLDSSVRPSITLTGIALPAKTLEIEQAVLWNLGLCCISVQETG